MTNARLLRKLRSLLEDATDPDKKHIKKLRKVLRELKRRRNDLRASLDETDDALERQKINQEIEVINLQRSKGVEVYKELKRARKAARKRGSDIHSPGAPGETRASHEETDDRQR